MPIISRFLGIIVTMYWRDHAPPHFHATYGEYEVVVYILSGVVEGSFPRRSLQHVLEWCELHRDELLQDWELCRAMQMPHPIKPLE